MEIVLFAIWLVLMAGTGVKVFLAQQSLKQSKGTAGA